MIPDSLRKALKPLASGSKKARKQTLQAVAKEASHIAGDTKRALAAFGRDDGFDVLLKLSLSKNRPSLPADPEDEAFAELIAAALAKEKKGPKTLKADPRPAVEPPRLSDEEVYRRVQALLKETRSSGR